MAKNVFKDERLSMSQKNANKKDWYKKKADQLDVLAVSNNNIFGEEKDYTKEVKKMKVNYDLMNNILNLQDFDYVCKPFGENGGGELPADMVNRDITSGKIKALIGMEMKRPFSYSVLATNAEATTRKEAELYNRIKQYVNAKVMGPIKEQIILQNEQETKGRELTPQEQKQIQEKIQQEIETATPPEVHKYMEREHQDPSEVQSQQLLNYLSKKDNLKQKFNKAFYHGAVSGIECLYQGILNRELVSFNVNSIRFRCDKSPDVDFIEDGEWASYEHRWTPSQIIKYFGDTLTNYEIDEIYKQYSSHQNLDNDDDWFNDNNDSFSDNTISVRHFVWKSLRKIGFLTRQVDPDQEPVEKIVDENYQINLDVGDIEIDWKWIPEVYETWKIGTDIYTNMRPLPGQFKDLNNLYHCKLPYYGVIFDNINSEFTSIVDRVKYYQYYYNIIMYRLELLMASDDGKKVLMNINAIPDSKAMSLEQWKYYFKSTPFMWYDPTEEGNEYSDVNTIAKTIDLSLISDITKYIDLAENIRQQAGRAIGITDQVEGQIQAREAVSNVRQNLVQSSNILEPYFDLHNHVKKNFLQGYLELAKVAYAGKESIKLSYVLDDMSVSMFELDTNLLDNTTLGVFVTDSSKAAEAKELIGQLAHAAVQSQAASMSDIIAVIRQEGIVEAEEVLKKAEKEKQEQAQQMEQRKIEAQKEAQDKQIAFEKEKHQMDLEKIRVKGDKDIEKEIVKVSLMGASFNPDQDADGDGVNDFVEIARDGLDAEIKREKNKIDRDKLTHQKTIDKEKIALEKKKIGLNKQNK